MACQLPVPVHHSTYRDITPVALNSPGTPEFTQQLVGRLAGRLTGPSIDGKSLAMLAWSLGRLGCADGKVLAGERAGM